MRECSRRRVLDRTNCPKQKRIKVSRIESADAREFPLSSFPLSDSSILYLCVHLLRSVSSFYSFRELPVGSEAGYGRRGIHCDIDSLFKSNLGEKIVKVSYLSLASANAVGVAGVSEHVH